MSVTTIPLVPVLHVESNDGVIRIELLACGHTTARLSTEGYAKRRRCAKCALDPQLIDGTIAPEGSDD